MIQSVRQSRPDKKTYHSIDVLFFLRTWDPANQNLHCLCMKTDCIETNLSNNQCDIFTVKKNQWTVQSTIYHPRRKTGHRTITLKWLLSFLFDKNLTIWYSIYSFTKAAGHTLNMWKKALWSHETKIVCFALHAKGCSICVGKLTWWITEHKMTTVKHVGAGITLWGCFTSLLTVEAGDY